MTFRLLLCMLLLAVLVGCASPGAPLPPSLRLPKPADDLTATRKGTQVLLTWTPPTQTTDHENIRTMGKTQVCRAVTRVPMIQCGTPVANVDAQVEHWTKDAMVSRHDYTDTLPETLIERNPTGFVTYALNDLSPQGKSGGLSNQVKVSLAPTLPAPAGVQAKVVPEGVQLAWTPLESVPRNAALSFLYRVFRRTEGENKPEVIVGEVNVGEAPNFLDRNIEWERNYSYRLASMTRVEQPNAEPLEVEGDDTPTISVEANDVFPPATPAGLQAVFSGVGQKPFIDVTWAPNLEADLAGYNVYRHKAGEEPVKINSELVKTPSFRDENVVSGGEYFYAVTALDARGNESGRSEEAHEAIPQ